MVFTKLSVHEKEAFFGLLDEYFQSRPEIFGQSGVGGHGASELAGSGISTAAAASIVQRAFTANAPSAPNTSATPKSTSSTPSVDVAQAMTIGRVAAASLAFSGPQARSIPPLPAKSSDAPPPSLPRRTTPNPPPLPASTPSTSTVLAVSASALSAVPGSEVDKLVTRKTSVFSTFKKPPSTGGVTIPPAFAVPKNTFGPPPMRRVTSETSTSTSTSTSAGVAGSAGTGAQRPQPKLRYQSQPEPEPEMMQGEWAEVLYDYSSEDPGDLAIEAGTRVLVTDKSSEDWWTGQVEGQGRDGLFPASYVKLL